MATQGPTHVSRIYIKAVATRIWDALVDGNQTEHWFYDARFEGEPKLGADYRYEMNGITIVHGHVLEAEAPHTLVMSFNAEWGDAVAADPTSRIRWEVNPLPTGVCEVRVVNDGFDGVTATFNRVAGGMTYVLSALKTWVETGQNLASGPTF